MTNKKNIKVDKRVELKNTPLKINLLWLVLLTAFICEALLYTWSRVQCVQTGYTITEKTNRLQELQTRNNSLKIELAHLKSAENISRIARGRLGLGMPDPKQIIVVP